MCAENTAAIAASAVALGAFLGAFGGTNMYLNGSSQRREQAILTSKPGERRHSKLGGALKKLRVREKAADRLTGIGLALVALGSLGTAIAEWAQLGL